MMKMYLYVVMLIFIMKKNKLMFKIFSMYLMMMIFLMMISLNMNKFINFDIYWFMKFDKMNISLIMLSLWILSIMFLVNEKFYDKLFLMINLFMLLLLLILTFSVNNYFLFYIFFEMSMIPTFLLIMGWGYQLERINASMYMFIYMMLLSLPMMIFIFLLFSNYLTLNMNLLMNMNINININKLLLFIFLSMVFMIKFPMFLFHYWLPKAHLEAPVIGSMILAGIMLKLGGYGLFRFSMMMMKMMMKFNWIYISFSLIGMLLISIICLQIKDMKLLVAYSSVVHMGMVIMGFMYMYYYSIYGGMILMIGHGLCSSGLFLMVNNIYKYMKSRLFIISKGINNFDSKMVLLMFILCMSNLGLPLSLNFFGEIIIVYSLFLWMKKLILLLMIGMYISSIYSILLFMNLIHGSLNYSVKKFYSMNIMDNMGLLLHILPLLIMFIKLNYFF